MSSEHRKIPGTLPGRGFRTPPIWLMRQAETLTCREYQVVRATTRSFRILGYYAEDKAVKSHVAADRDLGWMPRSFFRHDMVIPDRSLVRKSSTRKAKDQMRR